MRDLELFQAVLGLSEPWRVVARPPLDAGRGALRARATKREVRRCRQWNLAYDAPLGDDRDERHPELLPRRNHGAREPDREARVLLVDRVRPS